MYAIHIQNLRFLFLHLFITVVLDLCFSGRNIFYFGFGKVARSLHGEMYECSVLACVFGSWVESSHRENMLLLDNEVAANDTACTSSTAGVCCQVGAAC